jgi:hypothetical protein
LRGRSVWASSILHGSINATAGFAVIFVRGGDDLPIGMTGLGGMAALALASGALCMADRARGGALNFARLIAVPRGDMRTASALRSATEAA